MSATYKEELGKVEQDVGQFFLDDPPIIESISILH